MAENLENQTTDVTNVTETKPENDNSELFTKLDAILEKRLDGLTKSILKDNGTSDDDIKEIISQYKTHKVTKNKQTSDELEKLRAENTSLKNQILDGKLSSAAIKVAEKVGIDTKYIPQVMKLADLSNVTKDGEIDEEKLNEAMAKVVAECEVFKKTSKKEENKGFKNIGGNSSEDKPEDSIAKIRKAMGLKN
jgi:hypothetical protein